MSLTVTIYDACTAAGPVPCLNGWPAAVFASAKILLKFFVEQKGALSMLKPLHRRVSHSAPMLTACVCRARARFRCALTVPPSLLTFALSQCSTFPGMAAQV